MVSDNNCLSQTIKAFQYIRNWNQQHTITEILVKWANFLSTYEHDGKEVVEQGVDVISIYVWTQLWCNSIIIVEDRIHVFSDWL